MTVAVGGDKISMRAAKDHSADGQFRFVSVDADGRGTVSAEGAKVIGIGQNKPGAQDRGFTVQINGVSKLRIAAGVNEGDRLRASDVIGSGTATATNNHEYGAIALEAGSSGAYIAVLVTPGQVMGA